MSDQRRFTKVESLDDGGQVVGIAIHVVVFGRLRGSPMAAAVQGSAEIGFTVLNFWIGGRRDEQSERLAAEVVPQLRQLSG